MQIIRDWNEFWFMRRSPAPLGLFRILFGACFVFWGILLSPPSLYTWFSELGPMPLSAYDRYKGSMVEISLFGNVTDPHILLALWVVYLVVAALFTVGLYTRLSSIVLFLMFISFFNRSEMIMNGADMMMRCSLFIVLFAPCGKSCSIDRLIAIARGKDPGGEPELIEIWAQRMLQIQVALVYGSTVANKLAGQDWVNGTAVYFPLHMTELTRLPVPALLSSGPVINLLTWGTLVIESSLATFIWSRRTRPYVLAAGVALHCGIEYALNVPMFSFIMISMYLNFCYNEWITAWVVAVNRSFKRYTLLVSLPDGISEVSRWWLVVQRLDCLHLLRLVPSPLGNDETLSVSGRGWSASGSSAMRRIALRFPPIWILAPLFILPGALNVFEALLPRTIEQIAPTPGLTPVP